MKTMLSPLSESYILATNGDDPAAFLALFAEDALVNDNGREFRGRDAIKKWSEEEIFAAEVRLELIDFTVGEGKTVISTKVDGNFDRTGLPDPLVIEHHIRAEGDRILGLTCRLAAEGGAWRKGSARGSVRDAGLR